MRKGLAFLMFAMVLALGSVARADARDPAAAEALFLAGREAVERADYATACPKFAESERLDPAPGTLINLSDCEERIGLLTSAWEHWREAMDQLTVADPRLPIIKERASVLEKRLPRLSIKLAPGASPDCHVTRDDVEVGTGSRGVALPVNPGEHAVRVTLAGRDPRDFKVALAEGESKELVVEPAAAAEAPPPAPVARPAPEEARASTRSLGFVVGGVGAASVLTGVVTGALALGKKGTVADNCDASKVCNQQGYDAAMAGRTFSTVSTVTFAAGLAALGVGAYLVLRSPRGSAHVSAFVPAASPSGASFTFTRSF